MRNAVGALLFVLVMSPLACGGSGDDTAATPTGDGGATGTGGQGGGSSAPGGSGGGAGKGVSGAASVGGSVGTGGTGGSAAHGGGPAGASGSTGLGGAGAGIGGQAASGASGAGGSSGGATAGTGGAGGSSAGSDAAGGASAGASAVGGAAGSVGSCGDATLLVAGLDSQGTITDVTGVSVDSTHVYYSRIGGIYRVAKTGGAPEKVADGLNGNPGPVALDDTHVYWPDGLNSIRRAPKDGGPTEDVVPTPLPWDPTKQELVHAIAVSSGVVVYGGESFVAKSPGFLRSVAVTGGAVTTLYDGSDGQVSNGCSPAAVADVGIRGTDAIFLHSCGAVASVPIAGGSVTPLTLFPGMGSMGSIAASPSSAFWTSYFGVNVFPSTGSTSLLIDAPSANGLALDGDSLYVTAAAGLGRVSSSGGAITPLSALAVLYRWLAVDETTVYWTVHDDKAGVYGLCARPK